MRSDGATVDVLDEDTFVLHPTGYRSTEVVIEPDTSATSYLFAAAAISRGRVRVPDLGSTTVQGDLDFVRVLERMGAEVTVADEWTEVGATGTLRGIDADMSGPTGHRPDPVDGRGRRRRTNAEPTASDSSGATTPTASLRSSPSCGASASGAP